MRSNHRRNKSLASLAGVVGFVLAIAIAMTIRPAVLHAQDETFIVTPSVADDDGPDSWEPAAASEVAPAYDDSADGQVLELPQVVAVDGGDAAGAASTDPGTASADSVPAVTPPGSAGDYAAQNAVAGMPAYAMAPMRFPGGAFAPAGTLASRTMPLGANWLGPTWPGYVVARPMPAAPFPATSPMLAMPRGSSVIMGGWWHHAR